MEIELPETISAETLGAAKPAIEALRASLAESALPLGLTAETVTALLTVMDGVAAAAAEDNTDLSPSEAAERLRVARPSVMRLIARGELSSRKEGGHYVVSPREIRSYQLRLAAVRREAFSGLSRLVEEYGF
jgi:excisionase family DNA binding protein